MITGKKNLVTKSNKMMAFVDLEDLYGLVEVVVFPNVFERCQSAVVEDNVVVIKGKLNFKEGEMPKLLADSVVDMDEVREATAPAGPMVKVRIPQDADEQRTLDDIDGIFKAHRGDVPALIYLKSGRIVRTGPGAGVDPSQILRAELELIAGAGNVKFTE